MGNDRKKKRHPTGSESTLKKKNRRRKISISCGRWPPRREAKKRDGCQAKNTKLKGCNKGAAHCLAAEQLLGASIQRSKTAEHIAYSSISQGEEGKGQRLKATT